MFLSNFCNLNLAKAHRHVKGTVKKGEERSWKKTIGEKISFRTTSLYEREWGRLGVMLHLELWSPMGPLILRWTDMDKNSAVPGWGRRPGFSFSQSASVCAAPGPSGRSPIPECPDETLRTSSRERVQRLGKVHTTNTGLLWGPLQWFHGPSAWCLNTSDDPHIPHSEDNSH